MIYSALYSSLTLTFSHLGCTLLAGLSRQIRIESQPYFYANVRFNFTTTAHFMDYLTSIGTRHVREVRHISLCGHLLPMSTDGYDDYCTIGLPTVLSKFPGLQLSTLNVQDTCHSPRQGHYCDCDGNMMMNIRFFIEKDGFQELTYLSTGANFGRKTALSRAKNNLAEWEQMLEARDGPDSGAKVEIFPVTNNSACTVDDGSEATEDYQKCDKDAKDHEPHEVEIRIQRGQGAEYVHTGWCGHNGDLEEAHEDFLDMEWDEIKEQGLTVIDGAMERWQYILRERASHAIPAQGLAAPS